MGAAVLIVVHDKIGLDDEGQRLLHRIFPPRKSVPVAENAFAAFLTFAVVDETNVCGLLAATT